MKLLVYDNQIAGIAQDDADPSALPSGFKLMNFDGQAPIEDLYIADGQVQLKPSKPSENATWTGLDWVEVVAPTPSANQPNWGGFSVSLRRSQWWTELKSNAANSVEHGVGLTLFLDALYNCESIKEPLDAIESVFAEVSAESWVELRQLIKENCIDYGEVKQ